MKRQVFFAQIAVAMLLAAGLQPLCRGAQVTLPRYIREILPNGITLDIMPRKGVPLVEIYLAIKGGQESEPADQAGLSSLTVGLLRRGTSTRSADQFSEALDALGGAFRTSSDAQATWISSEFLAADFSAGLELVCDAVLHATFPDAEVKKRLAQDMDSIKTMKDNPGQAISQYAQAFFFGPEHPYGRIRSETSLSHISRDSILAYYRKMYAGRNIAVAVVGDIDPNHVKSQIEKAFGAVAPGEAYRWAKPINLPHRNAPRLLLVDKPGATQTYFYIAQPGLDRASPDRIPMILVNTLFGGRFTSMLNEELRVKSGLSYGAGNRVDEDRLQGMNAITSYTKTDSTAQAIDLALATLGSLHEKGLTADKLASAKAYEEGEFPRRDLETPDQLANALLEFEIFGLDRREIDTLFQRINSVTLDQANSIAVKYFQTGGLTFILVGDASKIRESVKKYAPEMKEVSIAEPGFAQ